MCRTIMMMRAKGAEGGGGDKGEKFKRVGVLWRPRSGKLCRDSVEENLCGCLVAEGGRQDSSLGKGQGRERMHAPNKTTNFWVKIKIVFLTCDPGLKASDHHTHHAGCVPINYSQSTTTPQQTHYSPYHNTAAGSSCFFGTTPAARGHRGQASKLHRHSTGGKAGNNHSEAGAVDATQAHAAAAAAQRR